MMTTEHQWTVNAIKDHMRAAGSHWFDPDTMRFFGTRILPTVYQGPGGIYFVTSELPPHSKRLYSVREFDPANDDINTIGEVASMTRGKAVKTAKEKAAADNGYQQTTEEYRPVSVLAQFVDELAKHGNPATAKVDNASMLIILARKHYKRMVDGCNLGNQHDDDGDPKPGLRRLREHIVLIARHVGATEVIFSGDPRGCTVKLVFADGATNDFGKEGWCVPTE